MTAAYAFLGAAYWVAKNFWPQVGAFVERRAPAVQELLSKRSWIIVALVLLIIFIIDGASRVQRRKLKLSAKRHRLEIDSHKQQIDILTNRLSEMSKKLADDRPNFVGEVVQIATATAVNSIQKTSLLAIMTQLTVRNIGADSIATGWSLTVMWTDGTSVTVTSTHFPKGVQVIDPGIGGGGLMPNDYIYNKTTDTPITRGSMVGGWLTFLVPYTQPLGMKPVGTKLVVSFEDVQGNPYHAEYVVSANAANALKYLPGSSVPFQREEVKTVDRNVVPDIQCEIRAVAFGLLQQAAGTLVTVFLVLRNLGRPTPVADWSVSIDLPNESLTGKRVITDQDIKYPVSNEEVMTLRNVDQMELKTAEALIPEGGRVQGFLMYFFKDKTAKELDHNENTLRLNFTDITGRRYSCTTNLSIPAIPEGELPNLPGVVKGVEPKKRRKKKRS